MINVDDVGLFNRKISIMRYAETVDEYGLTHQELVDVLGCPIWARIEPARGHTYYEQYRDKTELITRIVIRYRAGLDNEMVVKYQNKLYKIVSIIDPYESHVKLELMCNLKKVGDDNGDDN